LGGEVKEKKETKKSSGWLPFLQGRAALLYPNTTSWKAYMYHRRQALHDST